jgi:hypothetical protein
VSSIAASDLGAGRRRGRAAPERLAAAAEPFRAAGERPFGFFAAFARFAEDLVDFVAGFLDRAAGFFDLAGGFFFDLAGSAFGFVERLLGFDERFFIGNLLWASRRSRPSSGLVRTMARARALRCHYPADPACLAPISGPSAPTPASA